MIQNLIVEIRHNITCPACAAPHRADQIKIGQRTTWGCNCGAYFDLYRLSEALFEVNLSLQRSEPTLVTLESKGPVRLIAKGFWYSDSKGQMPSLAKLEAQDAYYYDQGTCPTNFLPSVQTVIDPATGNEDPHGIFQWISTKRGTHK